MPDGSNLVIGETNTGTATTELQVTGNTPNIVAFTAGITDGVAIMGVTDTEDGVVGIATQAGVGVAGGGGGIGVLGTTEADNSAGVFGSTGADSAGVWGQVVAGAGGWPGVEGWSATGNGVRGVSVAAGGPASVGVVGFSSAGNGVVGITASASGFGGVFLGGLLVVSGPKSSAVRHPDGSHRLLYCMESPESWFEDFGRATLVRGRSTVKLDPSFAAVVKTGDYHVFVCPEGDVKGLHVSRRNRVGFEVREHEGGKSNTTFSYRVVARRKDIKTERFSKVVIPQLDTGELRKKPNAIEKELQKTPKAMEKIVKAHSRDKEARRGVKRHSANRTK